MLFRSCDMAHNFLHLLHHHHHGLHASQALSGHPRVRDIGKDIRKCGGPQFLRNPRTRCALLLIGSALSIIILSFNSLALGPSIPGHDISGSVYVTPHSSLVIPGLSGLYCESITISQDSWDNSAASRAWASSVYVLPHKPSNYTEYKFDITNDNVTFDGANNYTWYMRKVYLHPGSSFTINSCVRQGTLAHKDYVKVCVVRGKKGYSEWTGSHVCRDLEIHLPYCSSVYVSADNMPYKVVEDTSYYFIHFTNSDRAPSFKMNVSISSLDYKINESAPDLMCTLSPDDCLEQCTVENIGLMFSGLALITTEVTVNQSIESWSWEDSVHISWKCNGSFTGFVLIVFLPFMACLMICLTSCVAFVCFRAYLCPHKVQPPRPVTESANKKYFKILLPIMSIAIIPIILVMTFLTGILPFLAYKTPNNVFLSAGETYTFSVNKFICSGLTVDTNNGSSRLSAYVYLTDDGAPLLNQHSYKTIDEVVTCDVEFCCFTWRSYNHEGSSIDITVLSENSMAYFLHFNDDTAYNSFASDPSSNDINERIPVQGFQNFTYKKKGDNIFVLIIQNYSSANIILRFNSTEYSTQLNDLVCETHSYTSSHCEVSIPYGVDSVAGVIKVDGEVPPDRLEYLMVDTACTPRASSWTALWLPMLIVNCAVIYTLLWCCCLLLRKVNRRKFRRKQFHTESNVTQNRASSSATLNTDLPAASQVSVRSNATPSHVNMASSSEETERQPLLVQTPVQQEVTIQYSHINKDTRHESLHDKT